MCELVVDYDLPTNERIEAAKKALPWMIHLDSMVFRENEEEECDIGTRRRFSLPIYGKRRFECELFEFSENTSERMIRYRMGQRGYIPANPVHLLAFAEQCFKDMPDFGEWHRYVIGLGGSLPTVLGSQFQGMGTGTCFFFQHVCQTHPHTGGHNDRFLGVREID